MFRGRTVKKPVFQPEGGMMWIVTVFSLIGAYLNINKRRECFIIWTITNFIWFVYDLYLHAYAQSALFFVYFCLAIWGLIKWNGR